MKITIAERLHPFSHGPGTKFLIPRTTWAVQVFPTRLNFSDLEGGAEPFFLTLDFVGPVRGFTAEMDLERGHLNVFGITQKGFMRYQLAAKESGIHLTMEKTPEDKVVCAKGSETFAMAKGESHLVCASALTSLGQERLSLGMHKAQDWDLVRRRLDCKEIFPAWFLMASQTPEKSGENALLEACRRKIEQREKDSVLEAFERLFLAAFEGVLAPRCADTEHQGIEFTSQTPLSLLTESGRLIRSLFIQENEGALSLLPCLPPQFHCGRMTGVRITSGETLHFEWTKKTLRVVHIHSASNGQIALQLPKGIRSFRMTGGKKLEVDAEGKIIVPLEANKTVQLDRFEY